MYEILNFLKTYEYVIYFVFGLGAVLYSYRFFMAWMEIRASVFGLELVSAQRKLNQSSMGLFVLLFFTVIVFVLITFVSPVITPELSIPDTDETISSIATQQSESGGVVVSGTTTPALPTALPTVSLFEGGCIVEVIDISYPEAGETIRGAISVTGTANMVDFGYFKLDIAKSQQELWSTFQAGSSVVIDNVLDDNFDSSLFTPGEYVIQLVIVNAEGESQTPCRIPIIIAAPEE
jgi:hypothetical protein